MVSHHQGINAGIRLKDGVLAGIKERELKNNGWKYYDWDKESIRRPGGLISRNTR